MTKPASDRWFDHMPPLHNIPGGVPVLWDGRGWMVVARSVDGTALLVAEMDVRVQRVLDQVALIPNLDDPQGFGWALRELNLRKPRHLIERLKQVEARHAGWEGRHAVTGADRLWLARAWADEVADPEVCGGTVG